MTGLIAIDEAGDLGSAGTRYFTMAAIVLFRSRNLKKAAVSIPNDGIEHKWNNSTPERRLNVLKSMADQKFKIVYVVVDKNTVIQKGDRITVLGPYKTIKHLFKND